MTPERTRPTERLSLWQRLRAPADAVMVDAGAGGELLVARVRLVLTGILLLIPTSSTLQAPGVAENWVGLGVALLALSFALLLFHLVKREVYRPWLGFFSSAVDVSLVSGSLAAFLVLGTPHTAVNSKVLYEVYFLAILATSLRYDPRVCVATGLLAVGQYLAIVAYADSHWHLNSQGFAPFAYGMFSWHAQIARMLMLGLAAGLSTVIVLRTQRLRHLSASDRLTGLFNRGYFDARLAAELSRARRTGRPLALAMVDVDHFKAFNDRWGHTAGDSALRSIAAMLTHAVRRSDVVVRYGGEEFVLIFPETEPEAAVEKLEVIRQTIVQATIRLPRQQTASGVTISAGVASFPRDAASAEALVELADERLFAAKRAGRNRIVASGRRRGSGRHRRTPKPAA